MSTIVNVTATVVNATKDAPACGASNLTCTAADLPGVIEQVAHDTAIEVRFDAGDHYLSKGIDLSGRRFVALSGPVGNAKAKIYGGERWPLDGYCDAARMIRFSKPSGVVVGCPPRSVILPTRGAVPLSISPQGPSPGVVGNHVDQNTAAQYRPGAQTEILNQWLAPLCIVESVDDSGRPNFEGGHPSFHGLGGTERVRVLDAWWPMDETDYPCCASGHYCYHGGYVYYRLMANEVQPEYAVVCTVDHLVFAEDANLIKIENLEFHGSSWSGQVGGHRSMQGELNVHARNGVRDECVDVRKNRNAALSFVSCSDVQIRDCVVRDTAAWAVEFQMCNDCSLWQTQLLHLGAGGLIIGGTKDHPSRHCEMMRCCVVGTGWLLPAAVAVLLSFTRHCRVANSCIGNTSYTAISVGWQWNYHPTLCGDNVVSDNLLYNVGRKDLADLGGVYILGQQLGTRILNNTIEGVRGHHDNPACTCVAHGLYTDEGTTGVVLMGNVISDCDHGMYQHFGTDNVFEGNHITNCTNGPFHSAFPPNFNSGVDVEFPTPDGCALRIPGDKIHESATAQHKQHSLRTDYPSLRGKPNQRLVCNTWYGAAQQPTTFSNLEWKFVITKDDLDGLHQVATGDLPVSWSPNSLRWLFPPTQNPTTNAPRVDLTGPLPATNTFAGGTVSGVRQRHPDQWGKWIGAVGEVTFADPLCGRSVAFVINVEHYHRSWEGLEQDLAVEYGNTKVSFKVGHGYNVVVFPRVHQGMPLKLATSVFSGDDELGVGVSSICAEPVTILGLSGAEGWGCWLEGPAKPLRSFDLFGKWTLVCEVPIPRYFSHTEVLNRWFCVALSVRMSLTESCVVECGGEFQRVELNTNGGYINFDPSTLKCSYFHLASIAGDKSAVRIWAQLHDPCNGDARLLAVGIDAIVFSTLNQKPPL